MRFQLLQVFARREKSTANLNTATPIVKPSTPKNTSNLSSSKTSQNSDYSQKQSSSFLSETSKLAHRGSIPHTDGLNIIHDDIQPILTKHASNTVSDVILPLDDHKSHIHLMHPKRSSIFTSIQNCSLSSTVSSGETNNISTPKNINNILQLTTHSINIDIYVFGAQELNIDTKVYTNMLQQLVGSKYILLKYKRLQGIYICIFIRTHLQQWINYKTIKCKAIRTGIANLYGNKGAVGISFNICRTSFCFVNVHLAASRSYKYLKDRIEDLVLIVQNLELGSSLYIDFLYQFHAMFLLGDLNFRLQNITAKKAICTIEQKSYQSLIMLDELTNLRMPFYNYRNAAASVTSNEYLPIIHDHNNDVSYAQQQKIYMQKIIFDDEKLGNDNNVENSIFRGRGGTLFIQSADSVENNVSLERVISNPSYVNTIHVNKDTNEMVEYLADILKSDDFIVDEDVDESKNVAGDLDVNDEQKNNIAQSNGTSTSDLVPILQQFVEGPITFPPTYKFFMFCILYFSLYLFFLL